LLLPLPLRRYVPVLLLLLLRVALLLLLLQWRLVVAVRVAAVRLVRRRELLCWRHIQLQLLQLQWQLVLLCL
jgi:hypothetical protein